MPQARACENECDPGDKGCLEWDRWECQQTVDDCWFKAQLTCPFGCEEGECTGDPGECGTTQLDGRCDENWAVWCEEDALIRDECGDLRCLREPMVLMSRCVEASAAVPCLGAACIPK